MHVRIGLDGHELIHPHAAGLAHAPEVVALQIDEHDVFGALLGVGGKFGHLARIISGAAAARPRAGDRTRVDAPAADPHQPLGR